MTFDPHNIAALERKLRSMPPVQAMALRAEDARRDRLRLHAPLAANVNDKGSAFGGSLAGVMTLSAWALVTLELAEAGFVDAEVYVQDSHVRYHAPLYDDLVAEARLADGSDWNAFMSTYRERGKARASLISEVRTADGTLAASLEGRFVALRPKVEGPRA